MSNRPNFAYRTGRHAVRVETRDERPVVVLPTLERPRRVIRSAGAIGLATLVAGAVSYTETDPDRRDVAANIMVPGDADPPQQATLMPISYLGVPASTTYGWDTGGDSVTLIYPSELG